MSIRFSLDAHLLHLPLRSGNEKLRSLWPKPKHLKHKGALGSTILIGHLWLVMVMWLASFRSLSGSEAIAFNKAVCLGLGLETLIRLRHSRGAPLGIRSNRAFLTALISWDSFKSRISTPVNFERVDLFVGGPGADFGVFFGEDFVASAKDLPGTNVGAGVCLGMGPARVWVFSPWARRPDFFGDHGGAMGFNV